VGVEIARDHAGGGLKIVAAVQVPSDIASNFDFGLFRYASDGSLDPSFGTDGKAVTDFGSGSDDVPAAVALEPNGRIVVAGESDAGGSFDFALARYRPDGSLDTTFGSDGRVLTDFASGSGDDARALTLDLNGRIVAAGLSTAAGSLDFALARYRGNGSLDTTFGSDGKVLTDFGSNSRDFANGVAVEPDRKIVVVGLSTGGAPGEFAGDFALARYVAN
jgi:uncharacterized delta-60 repeat protein